MFGASAVIKSIATLVIVLVIAGSGWYITGLRADLAVSQENARKMTEAVEQQQQVIEQIKQEQKLITKLNEELTGVIKAQRKDMQALSDRFTTNADGSKRDIGEIAVQKPESIERAINKGTINALRCLELASGAPLTESEKNATKSNEINKECPSLANPKYNPVAVE